MKQCPACSREIKDQVRFCPFCGSATGKVESDSEVGALVADEFQIERRIREGEPCTLFSATHLGTTSKVILAILPRRLVVDASAAETLENYIRAAMRIQDPHAAVIREARLLNTDVPYVVLEHFDGLSLVKKLRRGPIELDLAVQVIDQVGSALEAAYLAGFALCAITPDSIWFVESGTGTLVKVTDLGISGLLASESSRLLADSGLVSPNLAYLSPEQIRGQSGDARSDVYSLGVVAYEMIAGRLPFEALTPFEVLATSASPRSLREFRPSVPEELDTCVLRALSINPASRQLSVGVLASETRNALAGRLAASCAACAGSITSSALFCPHCGSEQPSAKSLRFEVDPFRDVRTVVYDVTAPLSPPPTTVESTKSPSTDQKPIYLDDNVQFTVYRPKSIKPLTWSTMLAFAHLSERRPDAAHDAPDPIEEVQRQARQVLGEQMERYQETSQDSAQAVPREGEITFIPRVPGIEFNPPSRTFLWQEDVHREEFRLRATADLDRQTARGRLSVFLGSILIAEVMLSIRVDSSQPVETPIESTAARAYRKIFASYSHKDAVIVEQFERFAKAFGDRYLRDVNDLRAGEVWSDRLGEMICEANIFQLFWSSNSMKSEFVRREWEYALGLRRSNFIRPTYWEEPLPKMPEMNLPPDELVRLHFQRIIPGFGRQEIEDNWKPKDTVANEAFWGLTPAAPESPDKQARPLQPRPWITGSEITMRQPPAPPASFSSGPPTAGLPPTAPQFPGGARLASDDYSLRDSAAPRTQQARAYEPMAPQASVGTSSSITPLFLGIGCLVLTVIIGVVFLFLLRFF